MCDVVFITPNRGGTLVDASIGTLQLASCLQHNGISCLILPFFRIGDVDDFDAFVESALEKIRQQKCRIVSFYTRCDCYHIVLRLAQRLKEVSPEISVVFGGPQSDITAEDTVRLVPFVDYVCRGEGETTIYPFFSSLLAGNPDHSVPGLVYRRGAEVICNPRPALVENLDELPMPDYSLLPVRDDLNISESAITIDVGRGCPFSCSFCSTNSFWGRKYRLKSPQRICEEVKAAHAYFGNIRIDFSHDMFTLNREQVMETCRLIKQLGYPVRWSCSARLDCVDPELIDVMTDAGLGAIYFGVETGSPRMQKIVHKNLKLDRAMDIIDHTVSKNLTVTTSFIYGFPEETEEDISLTMAMMADLLKYPRLVVQSHLCAFMAGTELSRKYQDELTPADFYSDQTGSHGVKECMDLITGYPELFQQMMEYKTELRTKLRHFELFYRVWRRMRPVYAYLSRKYPRERLIDMYFDFVEENRELLEHIYEIPTDWVREILKDDRFVAKFTDDERFDMIRDLYRHAQMEEAQKRNECGDTTAVLCVDPGEARRKSLEQCSRYVAVVNWKDGKCFVQRYPYRPQ